MAGVDDAGNRSVDPVLYRSIRPVKRTDRGTPGTQPGQGPSFEELLQRQITKGDSVKFSAHAQKRLAQANVNFDANRVARLEEAVQRAAGKGARESLILMGDLALVVNIRNKTVITAVDGERMKQNVFTNIDSAVITEE